jgi:hypothetical protein
LYELIKGRQIVHMLLAHFKTFDNSEMLYGFDHLSNLACGTDLHAFVKGWKNILDNMNGKIDEANLRDVFYRKIRNHPDLKLDMNTYERLREENPSKTYKHLLDVVQNEINLKRQNRNMADRETSLSTHQTPSINRIAAPAGEPTPAEAKAEAKKQAVAKTAEQKETEKLLVASATKLAKNQKQIEKLTQDLAATTIGGGKGKGAGDKGKGKGKSDKPCYYFHHGNTCTRTTDCFFSHATISKAEKDKLERPVPRGSRAPSPSPSGKGEGKGKSKPNDLSFCFAFNDTGTCSREGCMFPHLGPVEVAAIKVKKEAIKLAKAASAGCCVVICATAIESHRDTQGRLEVQITPEETCARRSYQIQRLVESDEYHAVSLRSRRELYDLRAAAPQHDTGMSKRSWEKALCIWRNLIRETNKRQVAVEKNRQSGYLLHANSYCFAFAHQGMCTLEQCKFRHITEKQLEAALKVNFEEAAVALGDSLDAICAPATDFQEVHEVRRVHRVACAQTTSGQNDEIPEASSRAILLDTKAMGEISTALVSSGEISLDSNQESNYDIMKPEQHNLHDEIIVHGHELKRWEVKPNLRSALRNVVRSVKFAPEVEHHERSTLVAIRPVTVCTYPVESEEEKAEWDSHSAINQRVACLRAKLTHDIVVGSLESSFCIDTFEQIQIQGKIVNAEELELFFMDSWFHHQYVLKT